MDISDSGIGQAKIGAEGAEGQRVLGDSGESQFMEEPDSSLFSAFSALIF